MAPCDIAHSTRRLQLTASRPVFTPDDVFDIQQRCQKLRKTQPPPFGSSREWLDAAITAGFPLAQANAALNLALQGYERTDPDKARAARAAARDMAIDALRTRDPRVMAQMGDVAANLAMDNPAEARKVQWVWPLAACLREANCESMTDWTAPVLQHRHPVPALRNAASTSSAGRRATTTTKWSGARANSTRRSTRARSARTICDAAGSTATSRVSFSSRPPLPLR